MLRSGTVLLLGALATGLFAADVPAAEKQEPSRILFLTQSAGFRHGSVTRKEGELSPAEVALKQLGQQTGLFRVDSTQDASADFTKENLQNYDIVALYTTGDLPIAQQDLEYFLNDWLTQEGHGVLGFHSAADTFHNYEPYWDMIGGTFISHPWTAGHTVTLASHEPSHPVAEAFGEAFTIQDEIYMYRNWQPEKVRVLLSLDYSKSHTDRPIDTQHGYHVPVVWVKSYGDGKVVFNNLGHREETWTNDAFLDSIVASVKWIRGDIEAASEPNPDVSERQEQKARSDFQAGGFQQK